MSVKEVTDAITGKIDPKLDDRERYDLIERRVKERVAACEAGGLRCSVSAFFGGLKYFEIAQLEIQDVRLVYAPAEGIGNFGGETDNWRWPRHTGDWSLLPRLRRPGRQARDATRRTTCPTSRRTASRSRPRALKADDLVFVVGYPGRTQRHQTYAEVKETDRVELPALHRAEEQMAILEALGEEAPRAEDQGGRTRAGPEQLAHEPPGPARGPRQGRHPRAEGAEREGPRGVDRGRPARQKEYGDVMPALGALQAEADKTRERDAVFAGIFRRPRCSYAAQTIYLLSVEKAKKSDVEREPGTRSATGCASARARSGRSATIDARIDRALLGLGARPRGGAAGRPADHRPRRAVGLTPGMAKADADEATSALPRRLLAGTKMADKDFRLGLLDKTTAEIVATGDPFIDLALALDPLFEANREATKKRQGASTRLRPRYMEALLAQAGGLVAPDANSTLRVTFGTVKGVAAPDGPCATPVHHAEGHRREAPARATSTPRRCSSTRSRPCAPARRRRSSYPRDRRRAGRLPLDGRHDRRQLGLADAQRQGRARGPAVRRHLRHDRVGLPLRPVKTRSIHADGRYMLWMMTEVDGAAHLVQEMGVK